MIRRVVWGMKSIIADRDIGRLHGLMWSLVFLEASR